MFTSTEVFEIIGKLRPGYLHELQRGFHVHEVHCHMLGQKQISCLFCMRCFFVLLSLLLIRFENNILAHIRYLCIESKLRTWYPTSLNTVQHRPGLILGVQPTNWSESSLVGCKTGINRVGYSNHPINCKNLAILHNRYHTTRTAHAFFCIRRQ